MEPRSLSLYCDMVSSREEAESRRCQILRTFSSEPQGLRREAKTEPALAKVIFSNVDESSSMVM
jgi:hypothetical protein